MNRRILIAYDGSSYSKAAIDDLRFSGMPTTGVEAVVLSAVNILGVPNSTKIVTETPPSAPERMRARAIKNNLSALESTRLLAEEGAMRLRKLFPSWRTTACAVADPPTWAIVGFADRWYPDFIVMGSHGRTGLRRFLIGSVAQSVLSHARCSVRISRPRPARGKKPLRILAGVDDSHGSQAVIDELMSRSWPEATDIRLVSAVDLLYMSVLSVASFTLSRAIREEEEYVRTQSIKTLDRYAAKFSKRNLHIATSAPRGNPKHVLVDEADSWKADEIFVGAKRKGLLDKLLVGSVSASVALHAHCTVEVVRPRHKRPTSATLKAVLSKLK